MMLRVLVSGGFDPLHVGHLEMLRKAKYAVPGADVHVGVILNSDDWLRRKKGFAFMPWLQRAAILNSLRFVDSVVSVDDSDDSVCRALWEWMPGYFANGGDRRAGNIPEYELCERLGIEMLFGVGGGKVESSSTLVECAREKRTRGWGSYVVLYSGEGFKVKILTIEPGRSLSLQRHHKRAEHWYITSGIGKAEVGGRLVYLTFGTSVDVGLKQWHRIFNTGTEPLVVHEVQRGAECVEEDIERRE